MLFNTWTFALFGAIVWSVAMLLRRPAQNVWLLAASYLFYGMWDWRFCGLLLLSTVVDFIVGLRLEASDRPAARKAWLGLSLATNLGILGFFKYFNFFAESTVALLHQIGFEADSPTLHIILPVGISFYTFQTLSYSIDIYRRQAQAVRDPIVFALYVSYFPQLVAGPIERAVRLLPQLQAPRRVTAEHLASGSLLILIGMARKVAVADNMAPLVDRIFADPTGQSRASLMLGMLMFSLQIYGDFAGYSDIARGVSRLLGVELMENFQQPYFSRSITEFWRRWHISLSTWLRDYLYIPLGGNRCAAWKVYRNLMLTMLLGGLWHGANWTFVVWGGLHGGALAVHKLWGTVTQGRKPATAIWMLPVHWLLTMSVVMIAWVLFRSPNFSIAADFLLGIVGPNSQPMSGLGTPLMAFVGGSALMLFIDIPQALTCNHVVMLKWPAVLRGLAYAILILALVVFRPESDVPFIYFQF